MPVTAPAFRDVRAPAPSPPQRRRSVVALGLVAAAVAVGVILRFVSPSALWLDEALSVNIARLPLADISGALRHDGHPPLYYWLLHGWTTVVGDGDVAVRALSGLASVAALPLAWAAGRRVGGRPGAVAALVLFALSPYAVRYATEARMYALVMAVVLAGYLAVRRALEQPDTGRLAAVAALTAALVWLHYWGIYLVVATALVLLVAGRRARTSEGRRAPVWVVAALAVGGATLLFWLPVLVDQARHTGTPWADPTRVSTSLATTVDDLGGSLLDAHLLSVAVIVLAALALFVESDHEVLEPGAGLRFDPRTVPGVRGEVAVAALTLVLGSSVTMLTGSGYATRYAAVVVPLILLVAAAGVARLPRPGERGVVLGVVAALALPGLAFGAVHQRTQGGDVVAALDAQAAAHDIVVYCPDQLGPAFSRGLRADLDPQVFPTGADPSFVDWTDYAARNRAADPVAYADGVLAAAGGRTIWLVWASGYRTLDQRCELIASRFQEARPDVAVVVPDDGASHDEHAWLMRYGAG